MAWARDQSSVALKPDGRSVESDPVGLYTSYNTIKHFIACPSLHMHGIIVVTYVPGSREHLI